MYYMQDNIIHSVNPHCWEEIGNSQQIRVYQSPTVATIVRNGDYKALCGCMQYSQLCGLYTWVAENAKKNKIPAAL